MNQDVIFVIVLFPSFFFFIAIHSHAIWFPNFIFSLMDGSFARADVINRKQMELFQNFAFCLR